MSDLLWNAVLVVWLILGVIELTGKLRSFFSSSDSMS